LREGSRCVCVVSLFCSQQVEFEVCCGREAEPFAETWKCGNVREGEECRPVLGCLCFQQLPILHTRVCCCFRECFTS